MKQRTIVQVTPHVWKSSSEIDEYVRALSERLAGRGHRVLVAAPSTDERAVRAARKRIAAGGELGALGEATLLPVAEALAGSGGRAGRAALPVDVSRTIETLLARDDVDICHLHDPFAPSLPSAALRQSRALNVGTFHTQAERFVAGQVARRLVSLVFGRLDARHASSATTAGLMARHFPAEYRVVAAANGPDSGIGANAGSARNGEFGEIVFVDHEERKALRELLRALRLLDEALPWRATIVSDVGPSSTTPLRASLRERVRFVPASDAQGALAAADIVVAASHGHAPRPAYVSRIAASQSIAIVSDLPVYEERIDGSGLAFPRGDHETLAAQIGRVLGDTAVRTRLRDAAAPSRDWAAVTVEVEQAYEELLARRHDTTGRPAIRRRLERRPLIDVDLHMHTDHSGDCATPVEHLLATARDQGLGAIAITDHNEISGALEAARKAADYGVKVIVGEEVKTADQGEVIGLFLTERIPRGLTLAETVAEIRRQGGLVYVPHPFDRMHAVPDYENLLPIVGEIDAIEIYNPRVAIGSFNEEAERFADKYRIVRGAGSDSHVAAGLGSVRIRMRDFDGPEEFLESLRGAEIHTKSGTLLYVQALKFLETKATPAPARRARRKRRVKRAERPR